MTPMKDHFPAGQAPLGDEPHPSPHVADPVDDEMAEAQWWSALRQEDSRLEQGAGADAADVHARLAGALGAAYLAGQPEVMAPDEAQRRRLNNLWAARSAARQAASPVASPASASLAKPWWRAPWLGGLAGTVAALAVLVALKDSMVPEGAVPDAWKAPAVDPADLPSSAGRAAGPQPSGPASASPSGQAETLAKPAAPESDRAVPPVDPEQAQTRDKVRDKARQADEQRERARRAAELATEATEAAGKRAAKAERQAMSAPPGDRLRPVSPPAAQVQAPRPAPVMAAAAPVPEAAPALRVPAPDRTRGEADSPEMRTRGLPSGAESPASAAASVPSWPAARLVMKSHGDAALPRPVAAPFTWEGLPPDASTVETATWRVRTAKPATWAQALLQAWQVRGVKADVQPAEGGWRLSWEMDAGTPADVRRWFEGLGGPARLPDRGSLLVLPPVDPATPR